MSSFLSVDDALSSSRHGNGSVTLASDGPIGTEPASYVIPLLLVPNGTTSNTPLSFTTTLASIERSMSFAPSTSDSRFERFTPQTALPSPSTNCSYLDLAASTYVTTTGATIFPYDNTCYSIATSLDYGGCDVASMLHRLNMISFGIHLASIDGSVEVPMATAPGSVYTWTEYVTSTFEIAGQKYAESSPQSTLRSTSVGPYTYEDLYAMMVSEWPAYTEQPLHSGYHCTTRCGQCTIKNLPVLGVERVRLMYWPTKSATNMRKITAPSREPVSVVSSGTTFISPYAYLSFASLSAVNSCGLVGKSYNNVLVTLTDSAVVSSIAWTTARNELFWSLFSTDVEVQTFGPASFNYADLEWPYPPKAYSRQQVCANAAGLNVTWCDVITSPYEPTLVIPSEVKTVDPLWADCGYYRYGVQDPPYALTSINAAAMPKTIVVASPTPISAQPAGIVKPSTVTPTAESPRQTVKPAQPAPPEPNQNSNPGNTGSGPETWPSPHIHITLGTKTFTASSKGQLQFGSTIIRAGDPPVTSAGQIIHVASDGTVWGGPLSHASIIGNIGNPREPRWTPTPTAWILPRPVMTVGGMTLTRVGASAMLAGNELLTNGGMAVVSGTTMRLGKSGTTMMIGNRLYGIGIQKSSNRPSKPYHAMPTPHALTFGDATYTMNAQGAYAIDGQTLSAGAKITVAGTPISVAPDGAFAVVGPSTHSLLPLTTSTNENHQLAFQDTTYTADLYGDFTIDGQTLRPGRQITVSGTVISFASDGSYAIIGGSAQLLSPAPASTASLKVLHFAGKTYTADAHGDFLINGRTLHPGDMLTVSGTVVSLASDDAFVVIGGSTQWLDPQTTTATSSADGEGGGSGADGVGGLIMSGFRDGSGGGGGPTASGGQEVFFQGVAASSRSFGMTFGGWIWGMGIVGIVMVVGML